MQSLSSSMRQVARASPMRRSILSSTLPTASRPFSIQAPRMIKEDANRSAEELDKEKHKQLDKQKQGKGEWHETLASAGEANVRSDKGHEKIDDHDSHIEDLQKETAEQHEKDHPHGKAEH